MSTAALLQSAVSLTPASLADYFVDFQKLYDNRLWHELTLRLQAFYNEADAMPALPALYTDFVCSCQERINQLSFIKLAMVTARALSANSASAAIELLKCAGEKTKKISSLYEADRHGIAVLVAMACAHYQLMAGDLASAKAALDEFGAQKEMVESLFSVDPIIPATCLQVAVDYDKATMAFSSYYRNALLLLAAESACHAANSASGNSSLVLVTQHSDLERAHDLCVAALLGENTFNFGELLVHPILQNLLSPAATASALAKPVAFLGEAVFALNAGDHEAFDRLVPALSAHQTVGARVDFLRQKMCLMSLVEASFRQLKQDRLLPFASISQVTRVPIDEVEFLLIKALSIKLIRGSINEPAATFHVDWVLPRILDAVQIGELRTAVQQWRARVQQTAALF